MTAAGTIAADSEQDTGRTQRPPAATKGGQAGGPPSEALPDLEKFLEQIQAGSSSHLPFDAQHALISAQRSNIEATLRQRVLDNQDEMLRIIRAKKANEERTAQIAGSIAALQKRESSVVSPDLVTSLHEYKVAAQKARKSKLLFETLRVLQPALADLEVFEQQVQAGRIEAPEYEAGLQRVKMSFSAIFDEHGSTSQNGQDYSWLSQSHSQRRPRALIDLEQRFEAAQKASLRMLEDSWKAAIQVDYSSEQGKSKRATIKIMNDVRLSQASDHSISIDALARTLESRGRLMEKIEPLANALSRTLTGLCLSLPLSEVAVEESTSEGQRALQLSRSEHEPAEFTRFDPQALQKALSFVSGTVVALLPSAERKDAFSRAFLPPLVVTILKVLKQSVPPRRAADLTGLSSSIRQLQKTALELHNTISTGAFQIGGTSTEDEAPGSPSRLLDFAENVVRQCTNAWTAAVRDEARNLCSAQDANAAWDSQVIEVEPAVPMPSVSEESSFAGPIRETSAPSAELKTNPSQTAHAGQEDADGWAWGDDEQHRERPDAAASSSFAARKLSSSLQRSESTSSNRSQSPSSQDGRSQGVRRANAKSALGGVRVLRPKDQLGSGPLPGAGDEDEDAWGLDDDLNVQPLPPQHLSQSMTSSLSSSSTALAPPLQDDGEDAWFNDDVDDTQAVVEQSALNSRGKLHASTLAAPAIDDDDAWFVEDRQSPPPTQPSQHIQGLRDLEPDPVITKGHLAPASPKEELDVDEDAWGLSDAEKAKRASMLMGTNAAGGTPQWQQTLKDIGIAEDEAAEQSAEQGPQVSAPSVRPGASQSLGPGVQLPSRSEAAENVSQPANHSSDFAPYDDDLDDDAWGLSVEEQAAKRASRLFTPSSVAAASLRDIDSSSQPTVSKDLPPELQPASSQSGIPALEEPRLDEDAASKHDVRSDHVPIGAAATSRLGAHLATGTRTLDVGHTSRAPSVASSVSAVAPASPRSELDTPPALPTSDILGTEPDNLDLSGDTASTVADSDTSSSSGRPFPVESALPEHLPATENASAASLPATPRSQTSADHGQPSTPTLDRNREFPLETDVDALSVASVALSDDSTGARFPLESALPPSSSVAADAPAFADRNISLGRASYAPTSTSSDGPPSVASLPPTPKAERQALLASASPVKIDSSQPLPPDFLSVESVGGESRPYTPVPGGAPGDVPFPIHSAMPWGKDGDSISTSRTGPPSVASAGAGSDVALPPSPLPERSDTPPPVFDRDADQAEAVGPEGSLASHEEPSLFPELNEGAHNRIEADTALSEPASSQVTDQGPLLAVQDSDTVAAPQEAHGDAVHDDTSMAATVGDSTIADISQDQSRAGDADADSDGDAFVEDDPWGDIEDAEPTAQPQTSAVRSTESAVDRSASPEEKHSKPSAETTPTIDATESGWTWEEEDAPPATATRLTAGALTAAAAAAAAGVGVAAGTAPIFDEGANGQTSRDLPVPRNEQETSSTKIPALNQSMEKCRISTRSLNLTRLANGLIDDAIAIAQHQDGEKGEQQVLPSASALLQNLPDLFEIHRVLMPTLHQEILASVPALAMQFANDCRYLSKEVALLSARLEGLSSVGSEQSRQSTQEALQRESGKLTLLGKRVFEGQLAVQAQALAEVLQQTDSLLRVYQDERFDVCKRSLEQVVGIFEELDRAWGGGDGHHEGDGDGVLGQSARWAALGTLLEATLRGLWANIVDMDDIGEQEGQRLADLFRIFSGSNAESAPAAAAGDKDASLTPSRLERLFLDQGGHSAISSFVPSWIKVTGYLPEILLGSLADVEFLLFDAGALQADVDSTAAAAASSSLYIAQDEAKRLIRATFADTKRRQDLLGRVERGA